MRYHCERVEPMRPTHKVRGGMLGLYWQSTMGRRAMRCDRCGSPVAQLALCSACLAANRTPLSRPMTVTDAFWATPLMASALHSRHIGRVVRAYRTHPDHGHKPLSQEMVAAWMGITQSQLSRVETGPPVVHLDRLIELARLFWIPPSLLWFALPDARTEGAGIQQWSAPQPKEPAPSAAVWWTPESTVELVSQFTREDLIVDRRELVKSFTGVVVGAALLEPLEVWLGRAVDQLPADGRTGAIGYQEAEQIERGAQVFRDWDDQFGGGLRRKAVLGQLSETADLLRESHPPEIRRRLFSTMAQLSETAAIMSWDIGQQGLAQRYYALAVRASRPAGDDDFAANILAGMARQLLYLGYPADALELVRLAQDRSRHTASAAVRSLLSLREAWAYAHLGRVSAFRRATARAEEQLAGRDTGVDPYWLSYYTDAELAGTTGGRLLEFAAADPRHAQEAAEFIERAIGSRPPGRLRSGALDHLGLAEARLLEGELEEAARAGHEALEIVERTPSDRVRVKLAELDARVGGHLEVPAMKDLRERTAPLLATTASM